MNEQIGHPYRRMRDGKQVIQRRTSSQNNQQPANPHRVGHSSGLHPEDQPYVTDDLEEGEEYYTTRPHSSMRRYDRFQDGDVIQAGNRRIIVHYGEPPHVRRKSLEDPIRDKPSKRYHPLFYVGIFLSILIGGIAFLSALSALGAFWQTKQDDWMYGVNPRTFQADANVGHGSTQNPMSHFIALKLHGSVQVIKEPGDDVSKARSYQITVIPENNGNPPVKVFFQDLNRDGKLDMLVEIGDQGSIVTFMLFNNGSQFVSKL